MSWKLFLDDIRNPEEDCLLARSVPEAIGLIEKKGFPIYISFDHDLGDNTLSGKQFADIICEKILDGEWILSKGFSYQVHSDNPVGAENIRGLLNSFLSHMGHPFSLERTQPYSSRIK